MKLILSSMLALAIAGWPLRMQEPDDKGKPQQEEPKKQPQPKPKQQPDEKPKPQQPDEKSKPKPDKPSKEQPAPPPRQQRPEERQQPDEKQQQKQQKEQEKQQKEQTKRERNRPPREQTTQPGSNPQERSGRQQTSRQAAGKGERIPQERFHASFGREHHFRVARRGGDDRRFQYKGYWFEVVEVWPAGWSFDDDCYIEEDGDDYYLVDVIHPEVRVLVIVVSG